MNVYECTAVVINIYMERSWNYFLIDKQHRQSDLLKKNAFH